MRSYFGLKTLPFTKDRDPDAIFESPALQGAHDRLRYLVDRRGIGAVFGAPGTGKSTLLRSFLASLGKSAYRVCYLTHTTCAILDLCREIARGFGLEPGYRKADVVRETKERIVKLSRTQKLRPVLVLDEAHLLPTGFLEEIRLLTSFDADGADDLTVVIAGHPQLERNLKLAVNEALAQRIVVRIRLRSLHPQEVQEYLTFRLERAGRTATLFLPDAMEALAKAARGVPRLVDRVAEQSLLLAYRGKRKEIDADLVMDAVEEVDP
jgi:type II secretory pathway predicted ATPase ExeA